MRNPLTKEAFAEWLDKCPRARFDIGDAANCALTQYARSIGHIGSSCNFEIMTTDGDFLTIPGLLDVMNAGYESSPKTFEALATRLRS